jgi:hypothetical protein
MDKEMQAMMSMFGQGGMQNPLINQNPYQQPQQQPQTEPTTEPLFKDKKFKNMFDEEVE